jgi:hypothetical protein
MVAHVLGLPVEEGVLQLAPAGAAMATIAALAGRTALGRLRLRLRLAGARGLGRREPGTQGGDVPR